jgi:hypothetical protein
MFAPGFTGDKVVPLKNRLLYILRVFVMTSDWRRCKNVSFCQRFLKEHWNIGTRCKFTGDSGICARKYGRFRVLRPGWSKVHLEHSSEPFGTGEIRVKNFFLCAISEFSGFILV